MQIESKTSLVGFLLALSTFTVVQEAKAINQSADNLPIVATNDIESRLSRLTNIMKLRADNITPNDHNSNLPGELANRGAWGNGRGRGWVNTNRGGWGDGRGRDWVNGNRGGWGDGRGSGWINGNNWRNGWRDGGSFVNFR